MLRSLGIESILKWAIILCIAVALWKGFDGDLQAMGATLWSWVEKGAELLTQMWASLNA